MTTTLFFDQPNNSFSCIRVNLEQLQLVRSPHNLCDKRKFETICLEAHGIPEESKKNYLELNHFKIHGLSCLKHHSPAKLHD